VASAIRNMTNSSFFMVVTSLLFCPSP